MRAWAVVIIALFAGCSAPAASPPAEEPSPFVAEEPERALAFVPPATMPTERLDVSLTLSDRWLKPFRALDLAAATSERARVAWFVELEEEDPRASAVDGDIFLLKASTPDHHNLDGPRAPIELSDVAADGRARALRLPIAGRYQLAAEDARLTVNVWPGAPEGGAAQAFLFEGRFEPAEIDVAPGARVLLWNQAGRTLDVRETGYAAHVPLEGTSGRVTPIDEGLYRMVALAVDGRARGVASLSFFVDFERPSDRLHAGPFSGEFTLAEARIEPPRSIVLRAEHPLERLEVRFEAGSLAPAPASIVVALHDKDGTLARASSLTASALRLDELPAGEYAIEVAPEHGAQVWFRVEAEGVYRLPMPARLLESAT